MTTQNPSGLPVESGYVPVNGLAMDYEIHGTGAGGQPLVLLHGTLSTISASLGKRLPKLAETRRMIAVEQQGHEFHAMYHSHPFWVMSTEARLSTRDTERRCLCLGYCQACSSRRAGISILSFRTCYPEFFEQWL
jgi:hypothetical protein